MSIEQYRVELQKELLAMTAESTGEKTWTEQDVAAIMKGQTDSVLSHQMEFTTPKEYAELLSM